MLWFAIMSRGDHFPDAASWDQGITLSRRGLLAFIHSCGDGECGYRLTPASEPSPYALCFAIFGLRLAGGPSYRFERAGTLAARLRDNVLAMRGQGTPPPVGKAYRQLLAFTLSALAALGVLDENPLEDLVVEQIPDDLEKDIERSGSLRGKPQSGNQAMFTAIFLIHAQRAFGVEMSGKIEQWVFLHLSSMNRFGFWGTDRGMTHLQFQNGYHQYEILEYLGVHNPRAGNAGEAVSALADLWGHFAPYPGGGGCYDYDAVFIMTPGGAYPNERVRHVLHNTATTILSEQLRAGGFAESLRVRPRSPANLLAAARRVGSAMGNLPLLAERLRYAVALQRPFHDHIRTHWTVYSRRWDEANLWDSWFRMLTLARIQVAERPHKGDEWGFIDFPGIGFHPSVRRRRVA